MAYLRSGPSSRRSKAWTSEGRFGGYSDSTGVDGQGDLQRKALVRARGVHRERNRKPTSATTGWYALATFRPHRSGPAHRARASSFDPSNQITTDRSTGYLLGVQYFIRGTTSRLGRLRVFREQSVQLKNNRGRDPDSGALVNEGLGIGFGSDSSVLPQQAPSLAMSFSRPPTSTRDGRVGSIPWSAVRATGLATKSR